MNKWIGIGRLVRDPDVRYTDNGQKAIAKYSLAIDRKFKKDGEQNADFISCVAFGKTAEFTEKYLKKGTKIAVIGEIRTGSYTNKDGQKVYATDVVIDECEFAESKADAPQAQPQSAPQYATIPDGIENDLPFK